MKKMIGFLLLSIGGLVILFAVFIYKFFLDFGTPVAHHTSTILFCMCGALLIISGLIIIKKQWIPLTIFHFSMLLFSMGTISAAAIGIEYYWGLPHIFHIIEYEIAAFWLVLNIFPILGVIVLNKFNLRSKTDSPQL